jgi:hypothetical protein
MKDKHYNILVLVGHTIKWLGFLLTFLTVLHVTYRAIPSKAHLDFFFSVILYCIFFPLIYLIRFFFRRRATSNGTAYCILLWLSLIILFSDIDCFHYTLSYWKEFIFVPPTPEQLRFLINLNAQTKFMSFTYYLLLMCYTMFGNFSAIPFNMILLGCTLFYNLILGILFWLFHKKRFDEDVAQFVKRTRK